MKLTVLPLALGAALTLAGAPALAEPKLEQARTLFSAGAKAYDAGDYAAAIQAFKQAHEITPRPGLLFSMAQAHRKQFVIDRNPAHITVALGHYRAYVDTVKKGERVPEALSAIKEIEALQASGPAAGEPGVPAPMSPLESATRINIDSPTPGATISVDGRDVGAAPYRAEIAPGSHSIKISALGFASFERKVDVPSGAFVPIDQQLDALPARLRIKAPDGAEVAIDGRPYGVAPIADVETTAGEHFVAITKNGHTAYTHQVTLDRGERASLEAQLETTGQRTLAWVLLTTGAVGVVGGGVLGIAAASKQQNAQDLLDRRETESLSPGQRDKYDSLRVERDQLRSAAIFTAVGGVAVGATGFVLFLFDEPRVIPPSLEREQQRPSDPSEKRDAPTMEISAVPIVGPDGMGFGALGRF